MPTATTLLRRATVRAALPPRGPPGRPAGPGGRAPAHRHRGRPLAAPPRHRPRGLRGALLDRAAEHLRTGTVADLSLRALARDLGVSHAAPQRHFPDRR